MRKVFEFFDKCFLTIARIGFLAALIFFCFYQTVEVIVGSKAIEQAARIAEIVAGVEQASLLSAFCKDNGMVDK